ncbi:MAG TPA: DUF1223 domain-containing protein [Chthoniobacterales bacterium]
MICHAPAETPASQGSAIIFESGDTQVSLLELFTSEGCSSCPRAEKWMSALKSNPDLWKKIVPIAFHVDYWDSLGWRDRFSKSEFTARQRRYAEAWGGDSVYTPGFAVNGKEWRNWLGTGPFPTPSGKAGSLRVTFKDDGRVDSVFRSETTQRQALTLNAALLGNDLESDVKRGENTGRKLHHDFVVLNLVTVNMVRQTEGGSAAPQFTRRGGGDDKTQAAAAAHLKQDWIGSVNFPKSGEEKPTALAVWITDNGIPIQTTGGWLR